MPEDLQIGSFIRMEVCWGLKRLTLRELLRKHGRKPQSSSIFWLHDNISDYQLWLPEIIAIVVLRIMFYVAVITRHIGFPLCIAQMPYKNLNPSISEN
ncbi:hypothetical protein Scep_003343 [Stephania cephalantha]|uniref:Uncharacterized protein n=1 Tax=Stephania cephalantha TaxID=152367 RepID=A0AAP0KRZ1_9MAGN